MKEIYEFDFSADDGNWTLYNAQISGGVLDITDNNGYGQRSPDANWFSGANDDFEVEVDFKQDSTAIVGARIYINLVGDNNPILFDVYGLTNLMRIFYYDGVKSSQAFVDDTEWHTIKIRRVGTTFYFSIDGGAEISWDYGTAREIEFILLNMSGCTGDYDNFKYSFMNIPFAIGVGNPMIL